MIDVWDVTTFDPELVAWLAETGDLVRDYLAQSRQIFLDHDMGRSRGMLRPENPYTGRYLRLVEAAGELMASRTIRAWHYTRMTGDEIERLRKDGIELSTLDTLRRRLDAQIAKGVLSTSNAQALFEASPLNRGQLENRTHRFWMVSHPHRIDDSGVKRLLANWGGEVASFWLEDPKVLALVGGIGAPRVLEVAVPLAATRHSYSAGQAVVSTFARMQGGTPEKHAFDLNVVCPLPPSAILAVHGAGDPAFEAMGATYPAGYVDVSLTYWREITGNDD